ncbi:MAG: hypothetical protein Kow0077_23410 [Anaerolineae bacterium]
MKTRPPLLLLIIIEITVLFMFFIITDVVPDVRGGFGWWRWPYEPAAVGRSALLLAAILLYAGGAYALLRRGGRARWVLAWAWLGTALLPYLVVFLRHDDVLAEMFTRTVSGLAAGHHLAAAELDWPAAIRQWPALMPTFFEHNIHMSTSPPGMVLFYAGLSALFDALPGLAVPLQRLLMPAQCHNFALLAYTPGEWASAAFGVLMPVWSAFAVLPLYTSTRRILSDQQARWAAIWWPLVPGIILFGASLNTLYPLLSLLIFEGLTRWQVNPARRFWLGGAGIVMGVATFTYFGFIPLLGFIGMYVLIILIARHGPRPLPILREGVPLALWFGAGMALPWLLYWLPSGVTPLDVLRSSMSVHLGLYLAYFPWVWLHLQEWMLFTGLPLSFLWLAAVLRRPGIPAEQRGWFVGLALLITILVVDLSGTARAETGRVWLIYSPFVVIAAADGLARRYSHRATSRVWIALTACQIGLTVALAISWNAMVSDLTPRPDPPGGIEVARAIEADFGTRFTLTGWEVQGAGDGLLLALNWEAHQQTTTPYWFVATLTTPEGDPIGEPVTWQPVEGRYPTTCWRPGEQVGDRIRLPLPADAPPGPWQITLAIYANPDDPRTALPIRAGEGEPVTALVLGPVEAP